jgi:hypothetical protein
VLTLVLVASLAQAETPPADAPLATPAPVTAPAPVVDTVPHADSPRRRGLYSGERVGPGLVAARVGMATLFGAVGAGLGAGLTGIGFLFGALARSDAGATAIVGVSVGVGVLLVGLGSALGSALFGGHFGKDLVDALPISMGAAVLGAGLVILGLFASIATPMIILAVLLVAVAPPIVVELIKQPAPDEGPSTVALLRF